jgi:hypothetical protein
MLDFAAGVQRAMSPVGLLTLLCASRCAGVLLQLLFQQLDSFAINFAVPQRMHAGGKALVSTLKDFMHACRVNDGALLLRPD